jgi:ferric-dicitrate binding protein FerR (iron transport regulator)
MPDIQKMQELYQRLITATATEQELQELYFLADQPENEAIFHEMFASAWSELQEADDKVRTFIMEKEESRTSKPTISRLSIRMRTYWSVAAVLLILVGSYFYFNNKKGVSNTPVHSEILADVTAPQINRAAITLASGRKIYLDSASKGLLVSQGNVRLQKLADGQITYSGSGTTEIEYNTLTNPRGSKPVTLTLTDGTKVWLNTGSSLTYPVAFAGKERKVAITGEAYFEVTDNARMPFTVEKLHDDVKILVLGTHFNVNAYDDETAMKITLLEGAVKVSKGKSGDVLKPGQQAQLKDGNIRLINDVDMDEVMAWKNGKFLFGEKTDIETIMRQLARWYDVEAEYKGKVDRHFWGSISRNVNVSQVLKMLETTGAVHFKIEGKKVIVMPSH